LQKCSPVPFCVIDEVDSVCIHYQNKYHDDRTGCGDLLYVMLKISIMLYSSTTWDSTISMSAVTSKFHISPMFIIFNIQKSASCTFIGMVIINVHTRFHLMYRNN
jgi:hypothetical protein